MPPERQHSSSAAKPPKGVLMKKPPQKTERTHEENQERAYIAASRRSDRSLEARIESARRASEIHKKRTGRGLRVTEQDVINEDMYDEEEDDLPTQYQRLNAHLQTSSWAFNKKLHDYIATQHGVRNMFLHQQFGGQHMQPFAPNQFSPNAQVPMVNQPMLLPQNSHPGSQDFNAGMQNFNPGAQNFAPAPFSYPQPLSPYSPQGFQQQPQPFAQGPYMMLPQNHHHRAASISTPVSTNNAGNATQANSASPRTTGDVGRRLSLPTHPNEGDANSRPSLSRSTTAQSNQQSPISPGHALSRDASSSGDGNGTPQLRTGQGTHVNHQFPLKPFEAEPAMNMTPLAMSLPPEAQQMVGSALDPSDPRTAILMAGSDNLPQPFTTYTYNPNLSPKASRKTSEQFPMVGSGLTQTLAPDTSIEHEAGVNLTTSDSPPSAMMDNYFNSQQLFTPSGFGFANYFDSTQNYNSTPHDRTMEDLNDPFEENQFVNWDQ